MWPYLEKYHTRVRILLFWGAWLDYFGVVRNWTILPDIIVINIFFPTVGLFQNYEDLYIIFYYIQ